MEQINLFTKSECPLEFPYSSAVLHNIRYDCHQTHIRRYYVKGNSLLHLILETIYGSFDIRKHCYWLTLL
jgi:hypothetical protein